MVSLYSGALARAALWVVVQFPLYLHGLAWIFQ
jgi:hypothetical protein